MVPAHGQEPQPAHPSEQEMLGFAFRGRCWGPALTKTWPGCDDNDRDNLRDKPTAGSPQPHTWKDRWEQWEAGSRHSKERSSVLPNAAVFGRQEPVPLSLKPKEAPGCILHPNPAPPFPGHLWGAAVGCSWELPKDLGATERQAALTQASSLPVPLLSPPVQSLFEAREDHVCRWKLIARQTTGVSCASWGQRVVLERRCWHFSSLPPRSQER